VESFSARFIVSGGGRVELNYQDDDNFELIPLEGGAATIIVEGKIYVRALRTKQDAETYLIGQLLSAEEVSIPDPSARIRGERTTIPATGVAAWGADLEEIRDYELLETGFAGRPGIYTVGREPRLARAQRNIIARMVPAMSMELCSNDVRQLTSWWPAELVTRERAVFAASSGMRLDGRVQKLDTSIQAPGGKIIETAGSKLKRRAFANLQE
jgi:hypothetical protein